MKKYSKLIIAAIVALIFIGTFVFLWQKSQPKPVVYNEFTPTTADIVKTTIITGKIEPRNEVNVKPQISGIIAEIMKENKTQYIRRCRSCGKELPIGAMFNYCEDCYSCGEHIPYYR